MQKVVPTRFGLYVFDHGAPVGLRLALAKPERATSLISQGGNLYEEGLSERWDSVMVHWRQPSDEAREGVRQSMLTVEAVMWQYTSGVADESPIAPEAYALDPSLLRKPGNEEIQLDLLLNYFSNLLMVPRIHRYLPRIESPPRLSSGGSTIPSFAPLVRRRSGCTFWTPAISPSRRTSRKSRAASRRSHVSDFSGEFGQPAADPLGMAARPLASL
ncbi:hypothetical protein [Variovorax saccharolyticus]|uniref:hypothetical protein n=1 Tax=Variovorax saccharolyticus TaxID=3053516 RepID=UPI00336A062A